MNGEVTTFLAAVIIYPEYKMTSKHYPRWLTNFLYSETLPCPSSAIGSCTKGNKVIVMEAKNPVLNYQSNKTVSFKHNTVYIVHVITNTSTYSRLLSD